MCLFKNKLWRNIQKYSNKIKSSLFYPQDIFEENIVIINLMTIFTTIPLKITKYEYKKKVIINNKFLTCPTIFLLFCIIISVYYLQSRIEEYYFQSVHQFMRFAIFILMSCSGIFSLCVTNFVNLYYQKQIKTLFKKKL